MLMLHVVDSGKIECSFPPCTLLCCDFLLSYQEVKSINTSLLDRESFWLREGGRSDGVIVPSPGLKRLLCVSTQAPGILLKDERPHGTEKLPAGATLDQLARRVHAG